MLYELIGNILFPLIASLFFFIYFFFFLFASFSQHISYRYFLIFLISFSIFLIGRPLQVLLGPHPVPLIINNMRSFLFCAVVIPTVLISGSVTEKSYLYKKRRLLFASGAFLGAVYIVFNSLGTVGSKVIFRVGEVVAYDCLSPSMRPPFFGREVTIAAWIVAGLALTVSAAIKLADIEKNSRFFTAIKNNKVFHINFGILIFGLSLILGMLFKTWTIYYISSIFSALFLGFGVIIDIKELSTKIEKFIPFIKEELVQNISYNAVFEREMEQILEILGKKRRMDTFLLFMYKSGPRSSSRMHFSKVFQNYIERKLKREVGEEYVLVMSFGVNRVGVSIALNALEPQNSNYLIHLAEEIRVGIEEDHGVQTAVGIGRSYSQLRGLKLSYKEALKALDSAVNADPFMVIHIDTVSLPQVQPRYPYTEKKELLFAIKLADKTAAFTHFESLYPKIVEFTNGDIMLLRLRSVELIGAIIDAAITSVEDETRLIVLSKQYFNNFNLLKDVEILEDWLRVFIHEIVSTVTEFHEHKERGLILKAKNIIENQYMDCLRVENVTNQIYISPSYFKHLFKHETGMSFTDYLTEVRIRKAKEILVLTDKSITEVAYDVGYNDSNYFSTVFRQVVGETPSRYRKRLERAVI